MLAWGPALAASYYANQGTRPAAMTLHTLEALGQERGRHPGSIVPHIWHRAPCVLSEGPGSQLWGFRDAQL